MDMINGLSEEKRVLQLNISDLSDSNDKVIQQLELTRKSLKIKDNELKHVSSVKTSIKDTSSIIIPNISKEDSTRIMNCDFSVKKEINLETSIQVTRIDSTLTIITDIRNTQSLYVYSKKEYRNKRKNWFDRLFHWDWKKDVINRYDIHNSNAIIKIEDTRIIEIKD